MDDKIMRNPVLVRRELVPVCAVVVRRAGDGGAMDSPEEPAQYNATTKLGLQSLSDVLTSPIRRPWPRNRPRQPLRGSGVHRSDSTSGSVRRTRAGARRSARKSLEGLCGREIALIRPCTFSYIFPGRYAVLVQESSV